MKHLFNGRLMLAVFVCVAFTACNNGAEEKKVTSDSTKTTTTATTEATTPGDGVAVAPNLYKVVTDTLGIRMVEATYKPGDSSAMHSHPDYAVYAIDGGQATFYAKDGNKMVADMKQGMTMIRPAEMHSVKNNGKTDIHVMLFEVNRNGATSSPDANLDATKSGAGLYTVKNDTMGIRVLEINYKPGQESKMHWHPDAALYCITDGTAEFTSKDGKKQTVELKKGMAMITPSETHSVKNVGKAPMKAILVEVYRAMK